MKRITKNDIKKILGSGATSKQVDIVFSLVDFQSEKISDSISKEIEKLKEKKEQALKKIEQDFKDKSGKVFDSILDKTVQSILKKNGIKIEKNDNDFESELETVNKQEVEENLNQNYLENENSFEQNSSQNFYQKY